MKYLVIDTETTGLLDFSKPADAEGQPRLAHLAMIQADENGVEVDRTDLYVQPKGWSMPQGPNSAGEVNGLTDEFLRENGSPINIVLEAYLDEIRAGRIVVAFNAQFDIKIMRGELRRAGIPDLFEQTKNICVMRPLMKIGATKASGGGGFPKLSDATAFFGHKLEGAHQAINDAEGALIVLRGLISMGALPEAKVHYAKEAPVKKPRTTRARLPMKDDDTF